MAVSIVPTQRLVPGLIERQGAAVIDQKAETGTDQPAFSDMISDLLESVNKMQSESAAVQQAFLAGEPVELHQLMIKAEEAGVATDLLLEIRNKLLDTYREIMRMPM